jgi:hypothetical protein
MVRSDDELHAAIVGGSDEAGAGIVALAAIIGSSSRDYVRDLAASVHRLFGSDEWAAALREEKARTKATILALAVIADGVVTEAERPLIGEFAARYGFDANEVMVKIAAIAEQLRVAPGALSERVARYAVELDASERLEVFAAVEKLARRGSGAWPQGGGYRNTAGPTGEALVATFREALGITTPSP